MSDLRKKSASPFFSGQAVDFKVVYALFAVILLVVMGNRAEAQSDPVPPAAPTNLACIVEVAHVDLSWTNTGQYDQVIIRRNGVMLIILEGTATTYLDMDVPANFHLYSVHGLTTGIDGAG